MTVEIDALGPYRSSVEGRLTDCEDYLGRLRRSLAGEIAPDRHYFADKALELRNAAQALVDHVVDVEWWLSGCTEEVVRADGSDVESIADCGRAAGHRGPHLEGGRCPEQQVIGKIRRIADALRQHTDRLGSELLAVRGGEVSNSTGLALELRRIERQILGAASSLEAIDKDRRNDEEPT